MTALRRTIAATATFDARKWLALALCCTSSQVHAEGSAADLRCAKDEAAASSALDALDAVVDAPLGVPSTDSGDTVARAADVDSLLLALAEAHARWPSLRSKIEAQVLSYNYCDVFYGAEGWDLYLEDGQLYRTRAAAPPEGYPGFRAWGFVPGGPRIVPGLLEENELGRGQREWFVGDAVLEHCFPHPVTGLTPFSAQDGAVDPPGAHAKERPKELPEVTPQLQDETCPETEQPATVNDAPAVQQEPAKAMAPVPTTTAALPIPPAGGAPGDAPTTVTSSRGHWSLSGSFFTSLSTTGRTSMGVRAAISPLESFYVRSGLVEQIDPNAWGRPTYSWGVGYNDWRPNTFSLELNHWGPIPIDDFDFWGAMVDVGYKVPLPQPLARYLGLGVGINYPLKITPGLGASLNFKPWGDWFVMSGVRFYPFNDTKFTWTYGFGNWSWKPYTFSLAYNNWGPNEVFDFNFDKNGVVTFAWSWVL